MVQKVLLSTENKNELMKLRKQFDIACFQKKIFDAARYLKAIQDLLRPLGHNVLLSQSKCQYCELLINESLEVKAMPLLIGMRKMLNSNTRIYLEATTLLAICYLRLDKLKIAEPLISEVLQNDAVIRVDFQRRNFQKVVMTRFNEESVLATLRRSADVTEYLDPKKIQDEAGNYVYLYSDDDLYEKIGECTPQPVKDILLKVEFFSQKQLPAKDIKCLPSPERFKQNRETGKVVGAAIKKTIHRTLCDPENETHKIFVVNGLNGILKCSLLGSAVVTCLTSLKIGITALAIPTTAFVIKIGLDTFCELYPIDSIMEKRKERAPSRKKHE